MVIGFEDEKGKIFTEVVTKLPVPIMMQTTTHRVLGNIHVRPDQRLKDELDRGILPGGDRGKHPRRGRKDRPPHGLSGGSPRPDRLGGARGWEP